MSFRMKMQNPRRNLSQKNEMPAFASMTMKKLHVIPALSMYLRQFPDQIQKQLKFFVFSFLQREKEYY